MKPPAPPPPPISIPPPPPPATINALTVPVEGNTSVPFVRNLFIEVPPAVSKTPPEAKPPKAEYPAEIVSPTQVLKSSSLG